MAPLLEVKNLSVGIESGVKYFKAVNDISFSIDEGEIVGLAGESGCGKTMTALSITNLLPNAAKIIQGEIKSPKKSEMSMIFQETRQALNPLLRAGEQITETLELGGSSDKEKNKSLAMEMLKQLGFEEPESVFDAYPHRLSGGMCQRVMTAIAAIGSPRLLLADEPSSALDLESQERILSLLLQMNREFKTAILIISHDLSIIQKYCHRYLIMRSGKILEEGQARALYSSVNPYTKTLIEAIPNKDKRRDIENIHEKIPSDETTLLSIRDVSNVYVNRRLGLFGKKEIKPVLKHINLELKSGEIFGLTGKSGCGKTTLAKCILGLINYDGEIKSSGKVQMVFQEPGASLNPYKKIGWLVEEPLVIHKIGTPEERRKKVDEMLTRVGLDPSCKKRRVHELSGGQKQRVCISRALILEPRLLIADEAISSLDVSTGAQILNLFRELHNKHGLDIFFISHNTNAVEYLCDRIAVMRDGKIDG